MFEYISLNTLSKVTVSATFWWFITKIHTLDREVQLKSILGHIQDLQREIGKNKRQQIFTEIYKWKSWYIFFIGNFSEYLASRNFSMSSVWNLISFARKIPRKIHLSFFFFKILACFESTCNSSIQIFTDRGLQTCNSYKSWSTYQRIM